MAVTDRAAGTKGISAFIVEQGTPGLTPGKKEDKLGMRASDTSEVLFDNCRIPGRSAARRAKARASSTRCRCSTPDASASRRSSVGLAQGAYEAALRYARERKAFGKTISQLSGDSVEARRQRDAHRGRAAADLPRRVPEGPAARRTTLESSMAKLYASEIAVRVADDCVQIHGGYGFVKDYPAEKYFRDVKLTTIGEGTSEIQRLVIARQLLAR